MLVQLHCIIEKRLQYQGKKLFPIRSVSEVSKGNCADLAVFKNFLFVQNFPSMQYKVSLPLPFFSSILLFIYCNDQLFNTW